MAKLPEFKIKIKVETETQKKRKHDFIYLVIGDHILNSFLHDKDGKQITGAKSFQLSYDANGPNRLNVIYIDNTIERYDDTQFKLGWPPGHVEVDNRVPYVTEKTTGVCPECKGKKKVQLLNSYVPCNTCNKKGE